MDSHSFPIEPIPAIFHLKLSVGVSRASMDHKGPSEQIDSGVVKSQFIPEMYKKGPPRSPLRQTLSLVLLTSPVLVRT